MIIPVDLTMSEKDSPSCCVKALLLGGGGVCVCMLQSIGHRKIITSQQVRNGGKVPNLDKEHLPKYLMVRD